MRRKNQVAKRNNGGYVINDNEPDPLKMGEDEYLKAREEYARRGIAKSKRMRAAIEKDKKHKSSK
jgi:hypothetical protein